MVSKTPPVSPNPGVIGYVLVVLSSGIGVGSLIVFAIGQVRLERICYYITRPAIANDRLTLNSAGDVVLRLKSPYQDGTTHILMTP